MLALAVLLAAPSICASQPLPPPIAEGFRRTRSRVWAKATADHVVLDALVAEGERGALRGRFRYGPTSKDLEREDVRLFVDVCAKLEPVGTARTDGEGRLELPAPRLARGTYRVHAVVAGDGTRAEGTLRVVPRGARLAVLDLDGTLTLADPELAPDVLRDRAEPRAERWMKARPYPGACALTKTLAARGLEVVYLTGRPTWLAHVTRRWLEQQGCAPGHLVLAERNRHVLPHESSVGKHKRAALAALAAQGFAFAYAFGNASTDVSAYAAAGIPPERTYIIGEHAGEGGTRAARGSWEGVAESLRGP